MNLLDVILLILSIIIILFIVFKESPVTKKKRKDWENAMTDDGLLDVEIANSLFSCHARKVIDAESSFNNDSQDE